MAPVTRNGRRSPQAPSSSNFLAAESEPRSEGSRAASEDPSSYDGENDESFQEGQGDGTITLQGPMMNVTETHDDILHPLREAANRVGREVERFAEVLDEYNPLKANEDSEQHEMVYDMVVMFYGIAVETTDRLRKHHENELRKEDSTKWRRKMRGLMTLDTDDDMNDAEEEGPLVLLGDSTGVQDLKRWEQEAHTWDLLRRMLKLQFPEADTTRTPTEPINKYSSEHQIFNNFLSSDSSAQERATVLRWLRDTAEDSGEDIDVLVQDLQQNADRGDIVAHGWLHTKAALKNNKRIQTWSGAVSPEGTLATDLLHRNTSKTEALVTQLDPDAPNRQNRKLEAQDEYFERAIWLGCYELLRRGKSLDAIKDWCQDRTEIWRAVSMSGVVDMEVEDSENATTYFNTALWRRMCYAMAKKGSSDAYEKAVYGLLSGDLESVTPVCTTWNDRLFANYNALLRTQFETYVASHGSINVPREFSNMFSIFDALQFYVGDEKNIGARIVRSLRAEPSLKAEANEPLKLIQGALISKDFMDFALQQGIAFCNEINASEPSTLIPPVDAVPEDADKIKYIPLGDHDSMRVLAHMFIVFKNMGAHLGSKEAENLLENVVVAYINFLRLAGKEELISLYASHLSEDRCYEVLSRSLIDVVEEDQRRMQIRLMTDLGLDVQRFVRLQTHNLLADYPERTKDFPADNGLRILLPDNDQQVSIIIDTGRGEKELEPCRVDLDFLSARVERPDMLLVRSLEWHLLVDGLWSATYRTGTELYKRFYKNMKLSAAKLLAQNVPSGTICISKTAVLLGEELSLEDLALDDEYEEITDEADEEAILRRKLLQRHMLLESRSYCELERLMLTLDLIWDAANHLEEYSRSTSSKSRKDIRLSLNAVLTQLRPNFGAMLNKDWLKKSINEEKDFPIIRKAYLPEVILAFDHILRLAGGLLSRDNILECINLSTIVAAEDLDLAEMFMEKGRMAELVDRFASDSLALLVATGPTKSKSAPSKKLRSLGWKRNIWALGPRQDE